MTEREHVYAPLRKHLNTVDWCRIENMIGQGMADVNGCASNGVSCWIETKVIKGNQIKFQPFQPAWLRKRLLFNDRVFVLARKKDVFYLWGGKELVKLLSVVEERCDGDCLVVDYRASRPTMEFTSLLTEWLAVYHHLFVYFAEIK